MIRVLVHKQPRQVALDIYDGDRLIRANAIIVPNDRGEGRVGLMSAEEFAALIATALDKEINQKEASQ